jgi:hypothetical protein
MRETAAPLILSAGVSCPPEQPDAVAVCLDPQHNRHRRYPNRQRTGGGGVAESLVEHLLGLPRAAAVGWFLDAWHGIADLPPAPTTPQIPSLLGQLLVLDHTHPAVCSRQNRLVDPVEVDDGRWCFYVENQHVYRWAYRPGEPDPVVVGQRLHTDAWVAEQERLSGFLLQVCLFEALFTAPYSASAPCLAPQTTAAVLGELRPVLGPWRWPAFPTVFHASDDAIAVTCPNGYPDAPDGIDVMLGAQRLAPLAHLPNHIRQHPDDWEHARLGDFVW